MENEEVEDLIGDAKLRIVEIYEPDEWGPKKRVEPFLERLKAVDAELRELVQRVLLGAGGTTPEPKDAE
jgi:hypothetical protein